MRAKTVYETKLAELIKNTPNDSELGKLVREFHSNYDFENESNVTTIKIKKNDRSQKAD
jgi:hypothetical protein